MQFLPCSLNTVLFLGPQPALCLHREQKAHLKPGGMTVQKKKKLAQRLWVGLADVDNVDKTGASSRGLAPIGSKPEDKQILSTLSFYPPTTHLPQLSYHRGRNQSSLRFAFVHRNKPITAVKQYMGEESGWNKASLSGLYWQTTECEAQLFPVSSLLACMRHLPQWEEKLTSVTVACRVYR